MPIQRIKTLVKSNMDLWLNNLFLTDGFFNTVSVGETDVYSRDISSLISIEDEDFPDNMVWQSAFKEWVHESGITPSYSTSEPIVSSGVTVNGTFYSRTHPTYGHTIDYKNGRVIFNSPIASNSVVQSEFSYKGISVSFADSFENEQGEVFIETTYKDNPMQTGVITYPCKNSKILPVILIDVKTESHEPYEIGRAPGTRVLNGILHVWTRESWMLDQIIDLVMDNARSTIIGIDFNIAPYPLTYLNDINPAFTTYSSMANLSSPYVWRRIYFDEFSVNIVNPLYNMERSNISFTARVYPTF